MKNLRVAFVHFFFLILCVLPAGACRGQQPKDQKQVATLEQLHDAESFGALVDRLSGTEGYFDTDNLISNESSYLHALTTLSQLDLHGGAYLGVGPDQNFSYIAHIQPHVAIILDIRRDNLLLHLLYKALFEGAGDRVAFLEHLFAREPASVVVAERAAWDAVRILDAIEGSPRLNETDRALLQKDIIERVERSGVSLTGEDLQKIRALHNEFISKGPALRFTSHGRPPQSYYPSYRQLALEEDRNGNQISFLSEESRFQYVKRMHESNRIVPVVGNFVDPHPLHEIGEYLREIDEQVVAFYTSNVEFYLMYQQQFRHFAEYVAQLPAREDAVVIRSYFNRFRSSHPETMPGYASTQLVQYMKSMVERPGASYGELVSDYIR